MNENQKKAEESLAKIRKNLKISLYAITGANTIAGILFFIAYFMTKNEWFLVGAVILVGAGIAFWFVTGKLQTRFTQIVKNKPKNPNADK